MSKMRKLLDDYLFAPARYLDSRGDLVDTSKIKSFLSQPETKLTALGGVGLSILFAAAGHKNIAKDSLLAAAGYLSGAYIVRTLFNNASTDCYFDTKPEIIQPLPFLHKHLFRMEKEQYPRRLGLALTSSNLAIVPYLAMSGDFKFAAAYMSINTIYMTTWKTADWWRASQVLNENWNVLHSKPEEHKEHAREPEASHVPALHTATPNLSRR